MQKLYLVRGIVQNRGGSKRQRWEEKVRHNVSHILNRVPLPPLIFTQVALNF